LQQVIRAFSQEYLIAELKDERWPT
ncbi:MAG: hypothetical protein ACJAZO_002771, partial [Myxococcota bacterium]